MRRAVLLLAEYADRFGAITQVRSLAPGQFAVTCADESVLATILAELEQRLQGRDSFSDPKFRALADKANVSYAELVALKGTKQQKRVELGDLGEAIACLSLITHFGHNPDTLYPKNLGKLNPRVSDPGIDIVIIELPVDDIHDSMTFVECKATGAEGRDYNALFSAANTTNRGITKDRVFEEVQLLGYEASERDSRPGIATRVHCLLFSFISNTVNHEAHLHANDDVSVAMTTRVTGRISTTVMFKADMEALRSLVFKYRRTA